jgi:hypothetical protein
MGEAQKGQGQGQIVWLTEVIDIGGDEGSLKH